MKTVKELIKELKKFPPEAQCCAYEGESVGLSIFLDKKTGFIHCGGLCGCKEDNTEIFKDNHKKTTKKS